MVNKKDIEKNLKRLNEEYDRSFNSLDSDMPNFFSKLAVMELSGWIEESFDEILYNYIDSHMDDNYKKIIKGFIKNNYGFKFETNTFKIFSIVLGACNWGKIILKLPKGYLDNFKSILDKYSKLRNSMAHTYSRGMTPYYIAPSQVLFDFNTIWKPICKIAQKVQKL